MELQQSDQTIAFLGITGKGYFEPSIIARFGVGLHSQRFWPGKVLYSIRNFQIYTRSFTGGILKIFGLCQKKGSPYKPANFKFKQNNYFKIN